MYAVQRFDVRLETTPKPNPKSTAVPATHIVYAELPGPVTAYMLSPDAYMSPSGPGPFFGPYEAANEVDANYEVEIRLGRPFSRTAIVEHRSFGLTMRLVRNKKSGQVQGQTPVFGASASLLEWVPSNIINEGIQWPELGAPMGDPRDEYQVGK